MIVGVDVGGSFTKAVALEGSNIIGLCTVLTTEPVAAVSGALGKLLSQIGKPLREVEFLAVSGAGARFLGNRILDIPVVEVDEIEAIGIGGLTLSGKDRALVASLGTGTALVIAHRNSTIQHIGGTGVGGGTIRGLAQLILRRQNFEVLEELASKGNLRKVDLTVGDIAGRPVGIIPAEATASNFGNLSEDADEKDLAAGIFNLVGEVVGVIVSLAAKAYGLERDIVLVGRLAGSRLIYERINEVCKLFKVSAIVPENYDYCVAIGAAEYTRRKKPKP
ncbi:pantothenate kinase [Candidatus Bathyarchaeota archaeon]|nr:pantothenate kinase [Candidatus Bathyarchaeota archaeon]MBS7618261.1 pantothenate kinase [Candidatus Bathyarchaeota archaeon]